MKILIVEDDARVAEALGAYLRQAGYTTHRAGDGASGIAAVGQDTEAVILDLGLPDMDGLDVCRRIRGVSSVPIIIATARSNVESRIKGLHAGADDFVVKPYDVRELIARIEAVTGEHARPARRQMRAQTSSSTVRILTLRIGSCSPMAHRSISPPRSSIFSRCSRATREL